CQLVDILFSEPLTGLTSSSLALGYMGISWGKLTGNGTFESVCWESGSLPLASPKATGLFCSLGSAAKDCSRFLATGPLAQAVNEVSKTAKLRKTAGRL